MERRKAQKGKGRNKGGSSTNRRKRKGVQWWHNWYLNKIAPFDRKQIELIEKYRNAVLSGINKITKKCGLEGLESFEEIKESFSYEIAGRRLDNLLNEAPHVGQVVQLAKILTLRRQGSWFLSLFRQREGLQIHPQSFVVERSDDGEVCEVGAALPEWTPPLDPRGIYCYDAESSLLRLEELEKVRLLPELVGKSKKKWAPLYKRILEIQLSGEEVGPEHRELLGVESDKKLREFKSQALALVAKILAQIFPDLAEKQKIYRIHRGKHWKIQKSTTKERRKLYLDPYSKAIKPSPVRHLRLVKGSEKPTLETSTSNLSLAVATRKTEVL